MLPPMITAKHIKSIMLNTKCRIVAIKVNSVLLKNSRHCPLYKKYE